MCSDTSPPKHSTSPLRITSRECSVETRTETDISFGSWATLPQEVLPDQSPSFSSIPLTTPELVFPTILNQPKKEDRNNIQVSSMFTSKPSRVMDLPDFTEDSLFHALVLSSTEVFTSESMTQSSPTFPQISRTTLWPTSCSDGESQSELDLPPIPLIPSEEE